MRNIEKGYVILSIFCLTFVVPAAAQYGFNLVCRNDTIQEVVPESTAVFEFTLSNTGTVTDTFRLKVPLEADSFPSDEWVSLMCIGGVFVASGDTAYVDLMPDSADTTIQVHIHTYSVYPSWGTGKTTLFVQSEGDPIVRDSVNLWVRVPQFICGDCNGDGEISVANAVYLVAYIYRNGPVPFGQGDVNLDGEISIADAIYLVAYIYRGENPPCEPTVGTIPVKQKYMGK